MTRNLQILNLPRSYWKRNKKRNKNMDSFRNLYHQRESLLHIWIREWNNCIPAVSFISTLGPFHSLAWHHCSWWCCSDCICCISASTFLIYVMTSFPQRHFHLDIFALFNALRVMKVPVYIYGEWSWKKISKMEKSIPNEVRRIFELLLIRNRATLYAIYQLLMKLKTLVEQFLYVIIHVCWFYI